MEVNKITRIEGCPQVGVVSVDELALKSIELFVCPFFPNFCLARFDRSIEGEP
jgi:hypothetical protein